MRFWTTWVYLLLAATAVAPAPLVADGLPSWTSIGPDGGDVQVIAASPARPGWILAGLATNGYALFRSADRGQSWGAASDQRRRIVFDLTLGADGAAFYAATDIGLLRSTDGGASWSLLDADEGPAFHLVQAHPRRPGTLFAARGPILLRGTDGAAPRQAVAGPEGVQTLAFSTGGRSIAIYAGGGNGLWKSNDNGQTWRRLDLGFPGVVRAIAADPRNPRVLYAGLVESRRALLKSTDAGATWTVSQRGLPVNGPSAPIISKLAVDPASPSVVYAVHDRKELFRSLNGGRTWSRLAGPPGVFRNDLEATPFGLLAGTSAGVFLSTDRGLTWQARTRGLTATLISSLAIDNQNPPRLYAADVNAGIFKTANRDRPWLRLGDSLPQSLLIDPAHPETLWAGTRDGVAKSTNGGRRWTFYRQHPCVAVSQLLLDPREPSRLFASGDFYNFSCPVYFPGICSFFRSLDAGETWLCVSGARLARPVAVDPFTSAVYAWSSGGGFLRSTDGGSTWSVLSWSLSSGLLAISPRVEGTFWAGGLGQVHRSRDGGLTWQSFSAGLPQGYVTALVPDPADPETLYTGTQEHGLFKSTDGGETWSPAGLWPPGIMFLGNLRIDPADPSILYAGTDSLGVLRLDQ
jgi:photosystem II stability/assembly factor-like uncharacterized protein